MGKKEEEEKKDRAMLLLERKKIIFNLVLFLAASFAVLIGALTMAWFAMNKNVGADEMKVASKDLPFELSVDAPYSTTPDYSLILNDEFGYSTTVHETGGSTAAIKWVMSDDTYDSTNPNRGLRPGSKGSFSFNIIPKSAGTYTIYFQLDLTGYHAEFSAGSGAQAIDPASIKTDDEGNYILQTLSDRATAKQEEYEALTAEGRTAEAAVALKEKNECIKAETFLLGHFLLFESCDDG